VQELQVFSKFYWLHKSRAGRFTQFFFGTSFSSPRLAPGLPISLSLFIFYIISKNMKLSTSAALLLLSVLSNKVVKVAAGGEQSPFYYSDSQVDDVNILKYQKTGKMEQIGRTGVAAMHAVLLKLVS
jgi:hypothetical protein